MVSARRGLLLLVVAAPLWSCGLMARQHPCWNYVAQHMNGQVPSEITHTLAWERGAERIVRGNRAPMGFYWKQRTEGTLELTYRRQYIGGHELTACPAASAPPVTTPDEHPAS